MNDEKRYKTTKCVRLLNVIELEEEIHGHVFSRPLRFSIVSLVSELPFVKVCIVFIKYYYIFVNY